MLNWLIPAGLVLTGLIIATQTVAKRVGGNPLVVGYPLFKIKDYSFYNPIFYLLSWAKFVFDPVITEVLTEPFPIFFALLASAILTIFIFGFMKELLYNPDKLHGSARWGSEKDLKKFGLAQKGGGVILGYHQKARVNAIRKFDTALKLELKKRAPLICHSGKANTLLLAPTGSGKGVSTVIPTCLSYPGSLIVFDPKGENYNLTSGHRATFSHVLRFSPLSRDTVRFNPIMAIEPGDFAYRDANLIADILFAKSAKEASKDPHWDNTAKDLLTTTILHIRFSDYADKTFAGILTFLSVTSVDVLAAASADNDEMGKEQFLGMINAKHFYFDKDGNYHDYPEIHKTIVSGASRVLSKPARERGSVFSTAFTSIQLFEDPLIANATSESDFTLDDFIESKKPITLYLTVPYSDIGRISPVFRLLITFMLKRFSGGETQHGSVKLKNHLLFLLDEFPVLGPFPFLQESMGVLRGYGINFLIVCQALSQLIDLYGESHLFLDHCTIHTVFAPGKVQDAEKFSKAIGKESVTQTKMSRSGRKFDTALSNLNFSDNDFGRNLIDPEEILKLPGSEVLVMAQGMPPYIGKKVVYYKDKQFKDLVKIKALSGEKTIQDQAKVLPSYAKRKKNEAVIEKRLMSMKEKIGDEKADSEFLFVEESLFTVLELNAQNKKTKQNTEEKTQDTMQKEFENKDDFDEDSEDVKRRMETLVQ